MTDKFFTRELIGRPVETVGGRKVGLLSDIVINCDNGMIKYILIKPEGTVLNTTQKVDDKGRLVISTEKVRVEPEKIVIN
ncbi:MAG: PRC-barrel domain-containing protein [Candidatus Methanogranum gryphiswaldense]|nr:MAG: PRC-barrel domain-containing protein [Candidatus Methanogranum sp. U3.2.1]